MANKLYKINPFVMIGVPTLQDRPMSWRWMDYYMGLAFPLGTSVARFRVHDTNIALARNLIAEEALRINAEWVFFISDDVCAPQRAFEMLWRHRKPLVTGVYWSKYHPTQPYLWNDLMKGPFTDWTFGDFFKVDWAGCDCLLINTEVLKKIPPPWFSTDWNYEGDSKPVSLATEDLYFYTKTRQYGFDLYCDSAVQCDHLDRDSNMAFGLTQDMPQFTGKQKLMQTVEGKVKVADIGAGHESPWFGKDAEVIRIDNRPEVKPDILCDVRAIFVQDETFDVVHARHVLEHFMHMEVPELVKEWVRILKIGGELIINVPNLTHAAKQIVAAETNPELDLMYTFWQLYGRTEIGRIEEMHKCGFNKVGLRRLAGMHPHIEITSLEEADDGNNLILRCKKVSSSKPFAILPNWFGREGEVKKGNGFASVDEILAAENLSGDAVIQPKSSAGVQAFFRNTVDKVLNIIK